MDVGLGGKMRGGGSLRGGQRSLLAALWLFTLLAPQLMTPAGRNVQNTLQRSAASH